MKNNEITRGAKSVVGEMLTCISAVEGGIRVLLSALRKVWFMRLLPRASPVPRIDSRTSLPKRLLLECLGINTLATCH